MGKKTKSKQRLDTYYHYAKAQGYRSRAAYKLIQLNRKYNFLSSATVLIDLCAAPGGWMQVAAQFMPLNSTIVGVDLDVIKKVAGTKSFQGDITTPQCYEQLRKQTQNRKCDVVLNDGAPNVGANWSKDAYTQSELVLAALKLACSFLKEGGYFITKVFRSTDFQSLMWVSKKFFEKVEATKPKASRFSSAEIFVVCQGYLAPSFIDEKLFDAKFIFKDTEADHFREQLAGEITSIDKLLGTTRHRGGYADDAPMHLYKETDLESFIASENPLLLLAEFNKITVSAEEANKYLGKVKKEPEQFVELLNDIRVLGRREISAFIRWRGKVRQILNKDEGIKAKAEQVSQPISEEDPDDSSAELEKEVLHMKKKQIRELRAKEEKSKELMINSQLAHQQHQHGDGELDAELDGGFMSDMEELEFEEVTPEQQLDPKKNKKFADFNPKQMEDHIEEMYEAKRSNIEEKKRVVREAKEARKELKDSRYLHKEDRLKSRNYKPYYEDYQEEQQEQLPEPSRPEVEQEIKFQNPLAQLEGDELYISENEEEYQDEARVDPNEKVPGQVSDDDAYVIPKPQSDMEKRRKQLKKNERKKEKKLKRDVIDGEDVGGQIEIVKNKVMEDYNIDELAETLVLAKKMLHNRSREAVIDSSYGRYSFEDHDDLPKWFSEDEKKHNFKKLPITKEEFKQEKDRLAAINARVPKKILEARVRRKLRIQKKLKKTQRVAENVMSQEGVTEVNKLRQISKMYDKTKSELKDKKKYIVSQKSRATKGKDSRNVVHVDSRMKKDKRSQKIKKTRQVHRRNNKKARF